MNVKRLYPWLLLLCPPLADHKYKRSLKNPHSRLCCQDQTMWSIMYINAWKWWAWLHSHLARNLPGSSMCNSLQSFQAMGTAMSWTQCAWMCNRSQLSLFNLILVISSMWSTYSSWLSVLQVLTFIILTFSLNEIIHVVYISLSEGTDPFRDIQLGTSTKIFFSFLFIFHSWSIVADIWSKI